VARIFQRVDLLMVTIFMVIVTLGSVVWLQVVHTNKIIQNQNKIIAFENTAHAYSDSATVKNQRDFFRLHDRTYNEMIRLEARLDSICK
jgi:hypothetical protein